MANEGEAFVALQSRIVDLEKELNALRAPSAEQQGGDEIVWSEFNVPDARLCFPGASNYTAASVSNAILSGSAKRQKTQHTFKPRQLRFTPDAYIPDIHRRTADLLVLIQDSDAVWNVFDYAFGTITKKCSPKDAPVSATGMRRDAIQLHATTAAEKWLAAALLLARDLDGCKNLSVFAAMDFATRRSKSGLETVLKDARTFLERNQ
jgi:hypothetical protein